MRAIRMVSAYCDEGSVTANCSSSTSASSGRRTATMWIVSCTLPIVVGRSTVFGAAGKRARKWATLDVYRTLPGGARTGVAVGMPPGCEARLVEWALPSPTMSPTATRTASVIPIAALCPR